MVEDYGMASLEPRVTEMASCMHRIGRCKDCFLCNVDVYLTADFAPLSAVDFR